MNVHAIARQIALTLTLMVAAASGNSITNAEQLKRSSRIGAHVLRRAANQGCVVKFAQVHRCWH